MIIYQPYEKPKSFVLLDIEDRYGLNATIELEIFEVTGRVHSYLASIFLANLFDLLAVRAWV